MENSAGGDSTGYFACIDGGRGHAAFYYGSIFPGFGISVERGSDADYVFLCNFFIDRSYLRLEVQKVYFRCRGGLVFV